LTIAPESPEPERSRAIVRIIFFGGGKKKAKRRGVRTQQGKGKEQEGGDKLPE